METSPDLSNESTTQAESSGRFDYWKDLREKERVRFKPGVYENLPYFKEKIAAIADNFWSSEHQWEVKRLWEEVRYVDDSVAADSICDKIQSMPDILINSRIEDKEIIGMSAKLASREEAGFCLEDIRRAQQEYDATFRGITRFRMEEVYSQGEVALPDVSALVEYSKIVDDIEGVIERSYVKRDRFGRMPELLSAAEYITTQDAVFGEADCQEVARAVTFFRETLDSGNKDFSDELYVRYEELVGRFSSRLYEVQLTNPATFNNDNEFKFIVHASHLMLGSNEPVSSKDFYRQGFISTSLISEKQLGTYGASSGLIFSPRASDIVAAQPHDIYSYSHHDGVVFNSGGQSEAPPILPPDIVISETLKRNTKEQDTELDHGRAYNEVVLDLVNIEPTGVFIIGNGEGALHSGYERAAQYAKKAGLPLVEIDMSKYREKAGLSPFSDATKESIVEMIVRNCYNQPSNSARRQWTQSHHDTFELEAWNTFLKWREEGGHTWDEMIHYLIQG